MKQPKPKKCKVCATEFKPWSSTQAVCSTKCAVTLSKRKEEENLQKHLKIRKEAIKSLSQWVKEAQAAFNLYIRTRDAGKPCISSGRPLSDNSIGGGFDCGHYRSTGAASHLRFNTFNAHAQSKHDNRYLSGNVVEYRKRLIERIGLERVERLENDNGPRSFDINYLKRIKSIFTRRAKHLKKLRELK